jgi:hypothetical protein
MQQQSHEFAPKQKLGNITYVRKLLEFFYLHQCAGHGDSGKIGEVLLAEIAWKGR